MKKKDLTDKEKEERMNYLTIHKCKNEDERKELKELCDWYFKDTPTLTMSFSLTEEDLRVTMERDVELSAVAGAVKNQHHKKKIRKVMTDRELLEENNKMLKEILSFVRKVDSAEYRDHQDFMEFLRNVAADIWVEYTEPEQRGRLFNLINKKK